MKLNKKRIGIVLGVLVIFLLIISFTMKKSSATEELTKIKNQTIEGINIENAKIEKELDGYRFMVDLYNESVDKVKASLKQVVDDTPEVMKDKDIFIGITSFGDSAINYTIRVWVKNSEYWPTYFSMLEKTKLTFENDNIEIPFNQLDVHLKKD